LIDIVSDFQPDVWRLQAEHNISGLVSALTHQDAGVRRRVAAALRALGAFEAIPALRDALDRETDPATRSSLLAVVATLERERQRQRELSQPDDTTEQAAPPSKTERLIQVLNSDDPALVIRAARTLSELGDKHAVEPLVMLFMDTATPIRVRLAVAEALLKLESAPVEVALLGALRSSNWKTRRNGAAILGQLRAEWALEPLGEALFDRNDTVRRTALAALQRIGTTEARNVIHEARRRARQAQQVQTTTPTEATQPIVWPRRRRSDPTAAPTRRLDPSILASLDDHSDDESRTE
jgi:HEAT repeat protein